MEKNETGGEINEGDLNVLQEPLGSETTDSITTSDDKEKDFRLWKFLNSPFGLLLASSVVVTGVGHLYADYQDQLAKRNEIRSEALKLAGEFDYRLTKVIFLTKKIHDGSGTPEDQTGNAVLIWRSVAGDQEYQPSLPEYKNVHWYGILSRLKIIGYGQYAQQAAEAILEMDDDLGDFAIDAQEHGLRVKTLIQYQDALAASLN